MLNIPTNCPEPKDVLGVVATSASTVMSEVLMKKSGVTTPQTSIKLPLRYSEVGAPARNGLATLNKL